MPAVRADLPHSPTSAVSRRRPTTERGTTCVLLLDECRRSGTTRATRWRLPHRRVADFQAITIAEFDATAAGNARARVIVMAWRSASRPGQAGIDPKPLGSDTLTLSIHQPDFIPLCG